MRLLVFLLFVCSFPLYLNAGPKQEITVDFPNDTAGINALIRFAEEHAGDRRDSALHAVTLAYQQSVALSYDQGLAASSLLLGTNEMRMGRFDRAMSYYNQAMRLFRKSGNEQQLGKTFVLAGINSGMQNRSAEALGWFLQAKKILESRNDEAGLADIYYKIGLVYGQVNDFDKALRYQERSLKFAQQHQDRELIMGVYTNMGMLYGRKKEYGKAMEVLQKALILSQELHHANNFANISLNIGNVYRETGKYDSAQYFLHQAMELYQQAPFPLGISGTESALADLNIRIKQYDSALFYLRNCIVHSEALQDWDLQYQNYLMLLSVYKAKGEYKKAAAVIDTVMILKDSVDNTEKRLLVERTRMDYEMQLKEEAIGNLSAVNDLHTSQRNILLVIVIAGLLLLGVILISWYKIRNRNHQLKEQKETLEELNQVKDKLFSVISHDLRSPFSNIIGVLQLMQQELISEEEQKELIAELLIATTATQETLDNLLVWGNNQFRKEPSAPEPVDLKEVAEKSIALYGGMAANKSIRLINDVPEHCIARFDKHQLDFIIRNLVANAIKFSFSGQEVRISGRKQNGRLVLEVTDQGTGMSESTLKNLFNPKFRKLSKGTSGEGGVGLGMTLISDFLKKNNGSITVQSTEGKGSSFKLDIPAD